MISIFVTIKSALDKEAKTMITGIDRGVSHVYASRFSR